MKPAAPFLIALLDELARTRGRTTSAFRPVRLSQGLSELEGVVLSAVVGAVRPPTVSQIGRSLGHPRQVIQRGADSLVGRGLIELRDNPDHKRAKLLVPTAAGQALKGQGDAYGLRVATELTEGLDAELIERTVQGLHQIREAIEANIRRVGLKEEDDG